MQGAAELEPLGVLGALAVVDQLVLLLVPDPALAAGEAEPGRGEPVGAEEGPLAGGVVGPGAADLEQFLDRGGHGEAGGLQQVGAAVDGVGRAAEDAAGDAEDPRGLGVLGVGGPHRLAPGGGLAPGQQRPAVGDVALEQVGQVVEGVDDGLAEVRVGVEHPAEDLDAVAELVGLEPLRGGVGEGVAVGVADVDHGAAPGLVDRRVVRVVLGGRLAPHGDGELVRAAAGGEVGDGLDGLGVAGEPGGVVRRFADQVGLDRERPLLVVGEEVEAFGHLGGATAGLDVTAGGDHGQASGSCGADAGRLEEGAAPERRPAGGSSHVAVLSVMYS